MGRIEFLREQDGTCSGSTANIKNVLTRDIHTAENTTHFIGSARRQKPVSPDFFQKPDVLLIVEYLVVHNCSFMLNSPRFMGVPQNQSQRTRV